MTSIAYSSNEIGTSAVITLTQEDQTQISFPISSVTGGEAESDFFTALDSAVADYRSKKGI